MSRHNRMLIGFLLVELLLAGVWYWLYRLGIDHPKQARPDFLPTVHSTMGGVMGAVFGLGLVLYLAALVKSRRQG